MSERPHIRKCESTLNKACHLYHCALKRSASVWWHEYGYSWQDALGKMQARLSRHGEPVHESLDIRQYI